MPQPEKALDPGASPQQWFGHELRHRRKAAGYATVGPFAEAVQVGGDVILKIEKGVYRCPKYLAPRLDEALDTSGLFERAWEMVFGDADKSAADADTSRPDADTSSARMLEGRILKGYTSLDPGSADPMERRAFFAVGTLAALAPLDLARLMAPTSPPPLPPKITPVEIRQLTALADGLRGWDHAHGGGGMVGQIASHSMHWAVRLLSLDCPEPLRADFHGAVARLGLVAGASHFDAFRHTDARVAFQVAVECAELAGSWHLRAKGYSFLARQAVWIGQPDDGITHAEKGLVRSDRLTATERAMLHTARARAFGKLRNVRETLAAVGAADDAFAQRDPGEDPPWMAYYDEAQHLGDTAHALYDLATGIKGQDAAQAGDRFRAAVQGHTDAFARSKAISCTKLASLTMIKGDPREAAALGHTALDLSGTLTSRRAAQDLRELAHHARRHPTIRESTALARRIATAVPA
ncbi:XRE family transcriptional regulator [Streptomyces tsukubensis]|uniref:XRE family transcriptional regulator n=1 Tax=Streptomyces tsukubensis TaxID=83656 RepID=UPI00344D2527